VTCPPQSKQRLAGSCDWNRQETVPQILEIVLIEWLPKA
jgi:hypothetical protein